MSCKLLYKQQRLETARFMQIPSVRLAVAMNTPGQICSPMLLGRAHPLRKAIYIPARNAGLSRLMLRQMLFLVHGKGLPLVVMLGGP